MSAPDQSAPDQSDPVASPTVLKAAAANASGIDAYAPAEIAIRLETVAAAKGAMALLPLTMLAILAGAFIGFGAMFFNLVLSDATLGFAAQRVLGGVVFSLGLLLVVVAGAELFTGNNLLAMAWADGRVSTRQLLRNWLVACIGNFVGAVGLAWLVHAAGHLMMQQGAVGDSLLRLLAAKIALTPAELFWRGVLCNVLVCLAVWMTLAGRSVMDKAVAIIFPVTAFVAAGFEHSIANMFFFPLAMLHQSVLPGGSAMAVLPMITWNNMLANLLPVIAGNILGGSVMVALVYYLIYRRPLRK